MISNKEKASFIIGQIDSKASLYKLPFIAV